MLNTKVTITQAHNGYVVSNPYRSSEVDSKSRIATTLDSALAQARKIFEDKETQREWHGS